MLIQTKWILCLYTLNIRIPFLMWINAQTKSQIYLNILFIHSFIFDLLFSCISYMHPDISASHKISDLISDLVALSS